ncbi:MAG: TIGR03621 family F420-dependent LLM class oxidoreductase [Actinobacteria bacterium]|nr:TIGR03621 family F420-dependent LLM class oxidoreductase [Actinomycetota bacterium]
MLRPFRFGVSAFIAKDGADWKNKAREIEGMGYSVLLVADHFGPGVAPFSAMAVAAAATEELRVGTFVLDNDLRHPAVVAKELATLDVLSDGRVEAGIGAGWKLEDYTQTGIPFDAPGVRVSRLEEAVRIVKGFWTEERFSFSGEHYQVEELEGLPNVVQRPHPPIFIGGGGKRILGIAGREADIVGMQAKSKADGSGIDDADATQEGLRRRVGVLREAAGDRFDHLELNLLVQFVRVTDDVEEEARRIAEEWETDAEAILNMPEGLLGSEQQIADKLRWLRDEFGISYFTVFGNAYEDFAPVVEELAGT